MPRVEEMFAEAWHWLLANAAGLASAAVALLLGWYLSRLVSRLIRRMLPRAPGIDRNFAPLLAQVARYGIVLFAVVTALGFVGVPTASIYAVLGAAGLAVALALQGTLSNIAAGIMLIWLRPIAIGEYIVGDGVAGIVVEIGLFGTRLRSTSGLYIFTPNQKLWASAITNHSREPRRRIDVNITIPETSDVERVRAAMLRAAASDRRVEVDPPPTVHVETFIGDKIVLQLRAWVPTAHYLPALRQLTEQAKGAVNQLLATGGQKAEVSLGADPHTPTHGSQTPDLT